MRLQPDLSLGSLAGIVAALRVVRAHLPILPAPGPHLDGLLERADRALLVPDPDLEILGDRSRVLAPHYVLVGHLHAGLAHTIGAVQRRLEDPAGAQRCIQAAAEILRTIAELDPPLGLAIQLAYDQRRPRLP